MKLSFASLLTFVVAASSAVATPTARQSCPEASRFGNLNVSPTNVSPGSVVTISADFTCAVHNFDIVPEHTDYYLEVPVNNNGHEPDIQLTRRVLAAGQLKDSFQVTIPTFSAYFANASYSIVLETTYPVNNSDGTQTHLVGGIEAPITLKVT
ncbi:hypothetical protein BC834DRAFT_972825 [Gloeopeniophorella convolvens]|nr:hypothetical protein BC834DRAFT_972825 [Gloeopeniophorella convolvens]